MATKLLKMGMIVLLVGFAFACKSAPPVTEEQPQQPEVTEKPQEVPPKVAEAPPEKPPEKPKEEVKPAEKPVPVSDEEIRRVRSAIARAEEADADYYAPKLLKEAEDALDRALRVRTSDPNAARQDLEIAKAKADQAFDAAVRKQAEVLAARADRLKRQLLAIDADKFLPQEYQEAVAGIGQTEELFRMGELVEARDKAYATLNAMADLLNQLRERLRWLDILKRDTDQYLAEAESLGAAQSAPEEFQRVNTLYFQGLEAFQKYDLAQAEESLGAAREAAQQLVKVARGKFNEEKSKSRTLMLEVMKQLESASDLTVVTEDGTLIKPQPWSGEPFVEEAEKEQPESGPQSRLLPGQVPLPEGRETVVLGDVNQENLLEQAKSLWKQGVQEYQAGNFTAAEEYFRESRRLVEAYRVQAVNPDYPIYVVRLIPERRDCLWRIAEYNFIYGNPYLWPQIWRRNRKLIQHPDLIYPGWKLVIPPR